MDITTSAVQSYQSNQSLPSGISQAEQADSVASETSESSQTDDWVTLSGNREVYEWLAMSFPVTNTDAASISRLSQALHDYQLLSFGDLNVVNQLVQREGEQPFLERIRGDIEQSSSFSERQRLQHIQQVFATVEAASSTHHAA